MGDRNTVEYSYRETCADDSYRFPHLVWPRASVNAYGSMPLGNGDVGINCWVEENGDLLFFISKTDAYSEDQQLLKLGRVRVHVPGNPFKTGGAFRQVLDIEKGVLTIDAGEGAQQLHMALWVDAHHPVIRFEATAASPIKATITLELWRTALREITNPKETHSYAMQVREHEPIVEHPDTVVDAANEALVWYHRNARSMVRSAFQRQDLGAFADEAVDPLLGLTVGARIEGSGFVKASPTQLEREAPATTFAFNCVVHAAHTPSADAWLAQLAAAAAAEVARDVDACRAAHAAWWSAFWLRSHVRVSGTPEAELVTRGYQLQRYMHACAGRGAYPIKFNGSIFTTEHADEGWNPDYRLWGGSYWIQNTRLSYWPMLMDGDFDLMPPFFDLYWRNLPVARERARLLGAEGAVFPETMTIFGTCNPADYGYARPADLAPGLTENTYIRRYWQGSLEIAAMMLEYHRFTGDAAFLRERAIPFALEILRFYRSYYRRRDEQGKILFCPSQSLETWHEAVNPTPDIAGLMWLTSALLALEPEALGTDARRFCEELRALLPPLPTRSWFWTGKKVILPALQYDQNHNWENPELYAVFPYRLYGVGKPELERGVATFQDRLVKKTGCWTQDAIHAAMLGLTEDAKRDVVINCRDRHPKSRFPATWDSGGLGFDWMPDQDHGGVIMIALQRMLMQVDDDKIHLLPAWPKDWDVTFKLHAPGGRVVEGEVQGGALVSYAVSPPEGVEVVVHGSISAQPEAT